MVVAKKWCVRAKWIPSVRQQQSSDGPKIDSNICVRAGPNWDSSSGNTAGDSLQVLFRF